MNDKDYVVLGKAEDGFWCETDRQIGKRWAAAARAALEGHPCIQHTTPTPQEDKQ